MSDRLPPCDHDECPKAGCVRTCVTYTVQRDGKASCVYLRDGTKITVERDATTRGPAWLKVSQQAMIYAQNQAPNQTASPSRADKLDALLGEIFATLRINMRYERIKTPDDAAFEGIIQGWQKQREQA